MKKYIIKVNDKEYHSYKELCADLDINYKTFMKTKHDDPGISQWNLLKHFYEHIIIRMTDSSYFVNEKFKKC